MFKQFGGKRNTSQPDGDACLFFFVFLFFFKYSFLFLVFPEKEENHSR